MFLLKEFLMCASGVFFGVAASQLLTLLMDLFFNIVSRENYVGSRYVKFCNASFLLGNNIKIIFGRSKYFFAYIKSHERPIIY